MKTTDDGFLRLILCSNVLWKEVLLNGASFFVYVLFYGFVLITFSLFVDMLGLPGEILREDLVSEPNPPVDGQASGGWRPAVGLLLILLFIGAMGCITTIEIRISKSKLAVIKDPDRRHHRTAEIYPLCDVTASRGWRLANWMGVILRIKDRHAPVCFALDSRRAAAVIRHVNRQSTVLSGDGSAGEAVIPGRQATATRPASANPARPPSR